MVQGHYFAICPPSRDSLEKEQQLKPKYVQETKTFGKVSGNQWHLRCARQEDSVDDDGDISISEASSSEMRTRRTGTMTTSVLQIKYLRLYLSKRMKNVEEHCLRGATNAKPNRIFGENSTIKNLVYIL